MAAIRIERQAHLAVLRMDKARGNAIDEPFVDDLARAAHDVSQDDAVRGILLATAHPKVFCPGLDLVALYEYDRPALESFMGKFAAMIWALYALRKPVVAGIAGHAVAGGCILALTADYRVLRRSGAQIGLNEVKVGVPLPWSVAILLRSTVAPAALSRVALLGRNFAAEDALSAGLADELADAEGFEETCLTRLEEFAEKDALALGTTKAYLRSEALATMRAREMDLTGDFLDGWFSTSTRERIRQTVEALKAKG
jgi:enoyl-CoA hydratase/carnithine racemase